MANFWKQFQFPSPIDDILNKETFTLQELLDEDDVVLETKNHKEQLINFLAKPAIIEQLIHFIVEEPAPNTTVKEKLRYPVIATEILCSSQPDIEEVIVPTGDTDGSNSNLALIYNFYANPTVNILRANLVTRLASQLLQSKHTECLAYLHHHPESIHNILSHIEASTIPSYFIRLINLEYKESGQGTLDWLLKLEIPEKLLNRFRAEFSGTHSDAVTCTLEIMGAVSYESGIMQNFLSKERCGQLLGLMLEVENPSAFRYGMPVLLHLVKIVGNAFVYDSDGEEHHNRITPSSPLKNLPGVINILIESLPLFSQLLRNPTDAGQSATVSGTVNAFGWQRLRILQILSALLGLEFKVVRSSLLESEIFRIALEQIFRFPQNNFGHQAVVKLFEQILEVTDGETRIKCIHNINIIPHLINAEIENARDENSGKLRQPYMPYLHQMAFDLVRVGENDEVFKAVLEGIEGWSSYIKSIEEFREKSASAYPVPSRNRFIIGNTGYPMF